MHGPCVTTHQISMSIHGVTIQWLKQSSLNYVYVAQRVVPSITSHVFLQWLPYQ
jgi:hypothetical protein